MLLGQDIILAISCLFFAGGLFFSAKIRQEFEKISIFLQRYLAILKSAFCQEEKMKKILFILTLLFAYAGVVFAEPQIRDTANGVNPKILIAYFSLSGNTRLIAQDIQKMIGGDLFEIKAERIYALVLTVLLSRHGKS